MAVKTVKTKRKQLSKGQKTHARRVKQEARKVNAPETQTKNRVRVAQAPKAGEKSPA